MATRADRPVGDAPASAWARLVRRLTATPQQLDADSLRRSAARTGCRMVADCARGQEVKVSGRLRTVVYTPRTNLPTLEADLFDGSGTVTLVWLGRRRIAGIEPGREMTVRGRVAVRDGRLVIYNPHYELHA
jgi:RecJ-like exonuclease